MARAPWSSRPAEARRKRVHEDEGQRGDDHGDDVPGRLPPPARAGGVRAEEAEEIEHDGHVGHREPPTDVHQLPGQQQDDDDDGRHEGGGVAVEEEEVPELPDFG